MYTHGNPIMGIDPSGMMSLNELQVTMADISAVSNQVIKVVRIANKVKDFVNFLKSLNDLATAIKTGRIGGTIGGYMNTTFKKFAELSTEAVLDSLEDNIDDLIMLSSISWVGYLARHYYDINRYVILLPNVPGIPYGEIPAVQLKIGSKRVVLGYGSGAKPGSKKKGRITGFAVGFKYRRLPEQIWRMDFHEMHKKQGAGDVAIWEDKPFHYHVLRPGVMDYGVK